MRPFEKILWNKELNFENGKKHKNLKCENEESDEVQNEEKAGNAYKFEKKYRNSLKYGKKVGKWSVKEIDSIWNSTENSIRNEMKRKEKSKWFDMWKSEMKRLELKKSKNNSKLKKKKDTDLNWSI